MDWIWRRQHKASEEKQLTDIKVPLQAVQKIFQGKSQLGISFNHQASLEKELVGVLLACGEGFEGR